MAVAFLSSSMLSPSLSARAAEVEPIYSLSFLGGQYFFKQEKASLSGNVAATVAPAIRTAGGTRLLPSLNLMYQGTKQVVDVVGAGSVFQEQMDHRGAFKAVFQAEGSPWLIKPSVSYKAQLLKETKDEDWGKGLFDYQTGDAGLEAEYVYQEPFSVRLGYDYFYTFFPNYTTLESQAALDLGGQPLARELVGDRILDTHNHMMTLSGSAPLAERLAFEGTALFRYSSFPRQYVVQESGQLTSTLREDYVTAVSAGLRMPLELDAELRLHLGMSASAMTTASNQNSFDARRTQFLPRYYNYSQLSAGPSARLLFGDERQPVSLGLSGNWTYRRYPRRLVQDAAGTYLGRSLWQHTWMLSTTLAYPMAPRFALVFNVQHGRSSSDQGFQQFYSYDYSVTNYLFGFTYDY